MMDKAVDRVFRLPRIWSNDELKKVAHLFKGDIANISGWKDIDKQGSHYKDYFKNASSYTITNYKAEAKGIQGLENEIYLDLEAELPSELQNKFDVVFNHTVLEHVYNIHKAFKNICSMTKDVAIIVVPFLQVMHADYGDYWRFTPSTMKKLFEENNMNMVYCNFNSHENSSVYLFCIATKQQDKWKNILPEHSSYVDPIKSNNGFQNWVGCHAIQNDKFMREKPVSFLSRIKSFIKRI